MPDSSTATVLVVDDDDHVVKGLQKRLTDAGFHVATATCGTEAFRRARAGDVQAITLDVGLLDQIDGFDVADALRSHPDTAGIPIVFISGRADVSEQVLTRAAPSCYCLPKPYDFDALVAILDGALRPSPRA